MPNITLGVINSKDNSGSNFISTSVFGGVAFGVPVDGSLDNTVLQDESDTTYYQILGSGAADISQGFQSQRLIDLVPSSAIVNGVTFNLRVKLGPGSVFPACTAFPKTEVWGVFSPPAEGYFYGYQDLTTSFADYSFPLPVSPNGVAWDSLGVINFGFMESLRVGLRGRTSCPDEFEEAIRVDWSEASLTVDLQFDPTVETLAATSVGVGGAFLNGRVNPGQDPTGTGDFSTLFPVTWQFSFGLDPVNLDDIGSPAGYMIGNEYVGMNVYVRDLLPLTTYYYRLKAFCDGETFFGSVRSFKTLGADPSLGAF